MRISRKFPLFARPLFLFAATLVTAAATSLGCAEKQEGSATSMTGAPPVSANTAATGEVASSTAGVATGVAPALVTGSGTGTGGALAGDANVTLANALKLGQPISLPTVPLSQIAKNPSAFKGKQVATEGTVTAVCQERGCWMEISDKEHEANVRMHGHAFFVPKTSSGRRARVQGNVMLMKDGKECEEMASTGAQLELDATGVELL